MNFETKNPHFEQTIRDSLKKQEFMKLMGLEITLIEPGKIEGWIAIEQKHLQHKGLVHGGVTATLADIVAGFAAVSLVEPDHLVVTAEIKVSYLNPGMGNKLHAIGYVLKPGKKLMFCEAEIWSVDDNNRILIAKATTTMAIIAPNDIPVKK
jgi:uncharacterized protein (TIGR00369 family)